MPNSEVPPNIAPPEATRSVGPLGLQLNVSADNPLDFLRQNTRQLPTQVPRPANVPPPVLHPKNQLGPVSEVVLPDTSVLPPLDMSFQDSPELDLLLAPLPNGNQPELQTEQLSSDNTAESQAPDLLELVTAKGPKESLKTLRHKTHEAARLLEEKETELQTTRQELEKYKNGEAIPEVLQSKQNRIKELEHYEHLHALKLSPEFQQRYAEPWHELQTKAINLAQEYDVDPGVFDEALQIEGKRELNQYLRQHFDDVGTLEAREILTKLSESQIAIRNAERQPAIELERLRVDYQNQEKVRETQRLNNIVENSKSGWATSLTELMGTGSYPELTYRENDDVHNKTVQPIIKTAAEEYGKFVKYLASIGVKELPAEVAKMLAKRFQLSQASGVMAASRAHHFTESQKVINEAKRQAQYVRPAVGAPGGGSSSSSQRPPDAKTAGQMLIEKVIAKR